MTRLRESCKTHTIDSLLMLSMSMANYTKPCSFLCVRFNETMTAVENYLSAAHVVNLIYRYMRCRYVLELPLKHLQCVL